MRLAALVLTLLVAPLPALADVVSASPDAVAVTVYRDQPVSAEQLRAASDDDTSGLAMISETRAVDLPAGRSRIRFEGVADAIIPASVAVEGLPGRPVERNFDFNLLTPGSLIEKSVGGQVTIRRTNPETGQVSEEPAVLRSGPDGVVVETSHGVEALGCGAGPQALVFDHLPEGLAERPTLSVLADAPAAGRYVLKLSYLAVRIDWSADYVARIAADGRTLDLTGWLTLSNRTALSFGDAPTAVVAGQLARVDPDLPDIQPVQVTPECWPMGTTTSDGPLPPPPPPALAPEGTVTVLVVTAERRRESVEKVPLAIRATQSDLGDYKLYTLAEPTTLAARQMKQVRFLHQPRVSFEKLYVFDADGAPDGDAPAPATVVLRFQNKEARGLGLSLPAGQVSIRQATASDEYFVGENSVRDVPTGEDFELAAGDASDVRVRPRPVSNGVVAGHDRAAWEVTVTNAGAAPAAFELRQPTDAEGFRIVAESARHTFKNARAVWSLSIPAHAAATLTYTIETAG